MLSATPEAPPPPLPANEVESSNSLEPADSPVHGWYRFVLSYPPHLVRRYIEAFSLDRRHTVLDPFSGTGTTLVEGLKLGLATVGVEAHPLAALASRVKTNWSLSEASLAEVHATIVRVAEGAGVEGGADLGDLFAATDKAMPQSSRPLTVAEAKLIPEGFISERPLLRLLALREIILDQAREHSAPVREFFQLALAHVIANGAGNFGFGPEIYRTKPKADYNVLEHFRVHAGRMIKELREMRSRGVPAPCRVISGDARRLEGVDADSIDAVITSPPYPNEKDYTRITRVESVLLGLYGDRAGLRAVKESLLRSNTRNIFAQDDDSEWVKGNPRVGDICKAIERRREELGKTSGFERLYHKVVAHYFGGMARHFTMLREKLKPGARCAYVVGDQLSFLLVPIPTASLLGEIAEERGLTVAGCDLWRTRLGTRSGTRVREEVLILQKR